MPKSAAILDLEDYELYCEGRLADPYPLLRRLREEDPIHWSERLGSWIITRYDDVYALVNDPRLKSNRSAAYMRVLPEPQQTNLKPLGEHISNWLGFTDPPKHTRMRTLVGKVFTPRLAANMAGRIQAIVDSLLDRVESTGQIDIIKDFAYPLPATVICEILGIQSGNQDQFKVWLDDINAFLGGFGPSLAKVADRAYKSQQSVAAFIRELAYERRRRPCDDLISALASVEGESGGLTEQELLGLCVFLFSAGEETTVSLIGNSMLLLIRNPREFERLKAEPALINSAVEEFLRYESPIQILTRVVADEIEIRNRRMEPGQPVILVLGAANRDPEQFPDPDRLDIARANNRHLAFGWAIHFCLGAPLARIEAQTAISSIVNRYPGIRLHDKPLQWKENLTLRCLESLPMTF
jgi:pimeloyl-[acyl-carrier protein] synthase